MREKNYNLKYILQENVEINVPANGVTMKSVMTTDTNQIELLKFNKKTCKCYFFQCTILGVRRIEHTERNYTNEKQNFSSGIDKIRLKCDSIDGSFVIGLRQPFFKPLLFIEPLVKK